MTATLLRTLAVQLEDGTVRWVPVVPAGPAGLYIGVAGQDDGPLAGPRYWLYARCGLLVAALSLPSIPAARVCAARLASLDVPVPWAQPDVAVVRQALAALDDPARWQVASVVADAAGALTEMGRRSA